jgi:uncharacterized repeat protein (TIGR01451 family)
MKKRYTHRRLVSLLATVGLMAGLLATLGTVGEAHAVGGPPGGFFLPAGSTATLAAPTFAGGAVNTLTWGYSLNGTVFTRDTNTPGTDFTGDDVTLGPYETDQTLLVFLTDDTCASEANGPATYYSDGTPVDHVRVQGSDPYSMDFSDAGGDCADVNSDRVPDPGTYNFHVDLTVTPYPLTVTKTADNGTVGAGASDGYTITVTNPNNTPVALTSIVDNLPTGFTYASGSSTGNAGDSDFEIADPSISGDGSEVLTWSDPLTVPGSSLATLHFQVTVASSGGEYLNSASATADGYNVNASGETAPIDVNSGTGCPASPPDAPTNVHAFAGDSSAVVSWDPPEGDGGAPIESYTVNIFDETGGGGGFARIHADSVQTTDTSTTVNGLTNGDTYHFTVQATNCAGTGPESDPSESVTPAAGTSAEVIGPGNLSQSTGTTANPTGGDTTIGIQQFPPGTTGVGTLQELNPNGGTSPVRGAAPLSQFCGSVNPCIGNILEAKLHNGSLGSGPAGGLPRYKIKLLLDKTLVIGVGTHVKVWYDGNLADDGTTGGDPTPPALIGPCSGRFNGTACVAAITRTRTDDLKVVIKTKDIDPRLSTSK